MKQCQVIEDTRCSVCLERGPIQGNRILWLTACCVTEPRALLSHCNRLLLDSVIRHLTQSTPPQTLFNICLILSSHICLWVPSSLICSDCQLYSCILLISVMADHMHLFRTVRFVSNCLPWMSVGALFYLTTVTSHLLLSCLT